MQLTNDLGDPEQLMTSGPLSADYHSSRFRPNSQSQRNIIIDKKLKREATISYFGTFNTQEDKTTTITKDVKGMFARIVRKLIIVQCFFDSLEQYRKERLQQRIEFYFQKRVNTLPFYPDDKFIQYWTKMINLLQFSSAIIYPLFLTFESQEYVFPILTFTLDVFFTLDIILRFNTAYIDEQSSLKINYCLIAQNYFKSWFLFDFLSVLPYSLTSCKKFGFLKMLRILKYFIHKEKHSYKGQANQVNIVPSFTPDNSISMKEGIKFIIHVLLTAFLLIHIVSCGYHYLIYDGYIDAFYQATQTITTVGYGDSSEPIPLEFQIIWLIIGVGFYTFTIGDFAYMMQRSGVNQDDEYYFQLDQLNYVTDFPDKIKNQFQRFITTNLINNAFWSNYHKKMVRELPYQLQNYLVLSGMLQICETVPFFLQDINFTIDLLNHVQFIVLDENELVYREGQNSNEIYFLLSGDVRILTKNKHTLLNILEGTMFGEFEAIQEIKRATYAITFKKSLILSVNFSILERSMRNSPNLYFEVSQLFHRRRKLLLNSLRAEKTKRRKVRRSMLLILSYQQLQLTKQELQQEREAREIFSLNEYNQQLLHQLINKKRSRYNKFVSQFRSVVYRIIQLNQQLNRTPPEDWKDLDNIALIRRVFPLKSILDKFKFFSRGSYSVHSQSVLRSNFRRRINQFKFQWRLNDLQLKQIVLTHNQKQQKSFPTLSSVLSSYQIRTVASSPQRININYPKWIKDLPEDQFCPHKVEQFLWKYHQTNKRLDRIDKIWTKGSMIKFDTFRLKSQKDLDHLDTESSDDK